MTRRAILRCLAGAACTLAVAAIAGCYSESLQHCGDRVCPITKYCTTTGECVGHEQLDACLDHEEQDLCQYGDTDGVCRSDVCTVFRCGDGIRDPGEQCDDGNTVSGDGCSGDCRGRFAQMETPVAYTLRNVWMTQGGAYAIGDNSILVYDGNAWSSVIISDVMLSSIWGSSATDVWMGGVNAGTMSFVTHFDGATADELIWTQYFPNAIWGRGPSDIYAVGGTTVSHYVGTPGWVSVSHAPCDTESVFDVAGDATTTFLAASGGICWGGKNLGGAAMTRLDTLDSRRIVVQGDTLYALHDAFIRRYSIATKQRVGGDLLIPGAVRTFTVLDDGVIIAVGDLGTVLEYQPQTDTWLHPVTPTAADLYGVAATSATNVIIVGEAGTILH